MIVERKSIALDIVLTIFTLGLWNLWVQIRQISDVNDVLGRDEFNVLKVVLLTLVTLGLYFCYHEYMMTKELHEAVYGESNDSIALLAGIASFFGLWFVVDSYQQALLNDYVEKHQK